MSRPTRPRTPPPQPPVTPAKAPQPAESAEVSVHRPAARPTGSAQRRRSVRGQPAAPARTPQQKRPDGRTTSRTTGRPAARPAARVADLAGARQARRRRPGKRAVTALVVVVALVAASAWVLLGSPWFRVADIRITGTERTDVAAVQSIVDGTQGSALAGVDTRGLASQIGGLPLVESADVSRSWPGTLRVVVHEREAVAAVPSVNGGFDLVDSDARVLVTADAAPAGVPTLAVDVATALPGALQAALDVNGSLPTEIRSRVSQIAATGPDAVQLQIVDGPVVVWGSAERPERKAEVLLRLLADPDVAGASEVNVSAPDAPAVVG